MVDNTESQLPAGGKHVQNYELIFLDADETLLDFRKAERYALKKAFRQYGMESDELVVKTYEEINTAIWKQLERGELDQERLRVERFMLLFEKLGLKLDPVDFSSLYLHWLGKGAFLLPDAEETCAYLGQKYRMAMVTNGIKEVQRSRIGASPIAHWFEALIISEEAGSSKPNPAIFEYACRLLGYNDKSKMLMIGDSLSSDIRGGVNFGIDTCWFNPGRAPNPTELKPTYEIASLVDLRAIL
jgi:putative hydrolase of the HAD superfamily